MDPTALFAAQYAEAVKLRKGIDPIIEHYETLEEAYNTYDATTFNQTVSNPFIGSASGQNQIPLP